MRSLAWSPLTSLLLPYLLFWGCGERDFFASLPSALINGEPTSAYPAVYKIGRSIGGICGATLIGQRTLLTAAHCVPPESVTDVQIDGKSWPVQSTRANEGFTMGLFHDVGVIRLATPPPYEPVQLARKPPGVGQEVTLVGFGVASDGSIGAKRAGTNTVSQVTNALVVIAGSQNGAANTCLGDSGGPVFAVIDGQEVQVGIHSTMIGECGKQSQSTRVDAYLDWIHQAAEGDVAEAPPPPALGGVVATVDHRPELPAIPWPPAAEQPEPPPPQPAEPPEPTTEDQGAGCSITGSAQSAIPLAGLLLLALLRRRWLF